MCVSQNCVALVLNGFLSEQEWCLWVCVKTPLNEIKRIKENLHWQAHIWVVFSVSEIFPLPDLSFKLFPRPLPPCGLKIQIYQHGSLILIIISYIKAYLHISLSLNPHLKTSYPVEREFSPSDFPHSDLASHWAFPQRRLYLNICAFKCLIYLKWHYSTLSSQSFINSTEFSLGIYYTKGKI